MTHAHQSAGNSRSAVPLSLLVLGMIGVGINLRTLMAVVPPLLPQIRADLGFNNATFGVLTTLPVLCMGLFAPVAAKVAHRYGATRVVLAATGLVAAGNLIRGLGSLGWPLFLGTLIGGVGIALAGTLMPGLVKAFFPAHRAGLATGLNMLAMMGGAAVASALAVPLSERLDSWGASLGVWSILGLLGIVLWLPLERAIARANATAEHPKAPERLPWRSTTAWLVTGYLIAQSWQFYSSLAWVAPTYVEHGWTAGEAGLLLSAFAAVQFVSGLLAPMLADRTTDLRVLLFGASLLGLLGEVGIWLAPELAPLLWITLLSLGQGAAFALGMVMLVRYATSASASASFTAMAYLMAYGLAAFGPTVMGGVHDLTGSAQWIWGGLALIMVPQLILTLRLHPHLTKVGSTR